ncbi:MAG: zinc ribbon domain-containing protein [Clostridiales bacterium]|nr:zinc ribbon domain-containing protein [Clostridiales bacterium]
MIIIILIVAIIYFILYHKVVTVIYFKNMLVELVFELLMCFVLAAITIGVLGHVFAVLLAGLGGIISLLFTLALIVAAIAAITHVARLIYNGIKKDKKPEEDISTGEKKEESVASEDVVICPECGNICSADEQFCDQCGHNL